MDRLVEFFAPRGRIDFAAKLVVIQVIIAAVYLVQETLIDGYPGDELLSHMRSVVMMGVPGTWLSLALLGHVKQLHDRLARIAGIDDLTLLPNRRTFMEFVRENPDGVFIMLDVDHFKFVNDTYGHAAGDTCLQVVAEYLQSFVGPEDICARLGGEEFGIVLTQTSKEDALRIAARICAGTAFHAPLMETPHQVTLSAGVVTVHNDIRIERWLSAADSALYQSKATGRAKATDADLPFGQLSDASAG